MPDNHKLSRTRAWQLDKQAKGLCQRCGRCKARKLKFLQGHVRLSALCVTCAAKQRKREKQRNTLTLRLAAKSQVDSSLPNG